MPSPPPASSVAAAASPVRSRMGAFFPDAERARVFWLGALLLAATAAAYFPALRGELLWDDQAHVTKPELRSMAGLARIWTEIGATQQYYPVLHSAFWLEHRLWGDAVLGYHLVNVFLHAGAACLFGLVLRRLAVPGAWLAAFVFALHPVHVESVAWITEQKNTLSLLFYLLAALAYLRFEESRTPARYALALGLFVLALLSKTVTATLPAALLVVAWWRRGRVEWRRDVVPLLPWFALGAASGLLTAWIERKLIGAEGADFELSLVQRVLLAGRVLGFYLGKLAWPADLIFIYPRWTVDATQPAAYLFPLGAAGLVAACWRARVRARGPLAAALFFAGSLFPVLGFLNVYPFIFSFVADHFQYLASLGPIALVSSAAVPLMAGGPPVRRRLATAAAAALVGALAVLTWWQSGMYRSLDALYRTTLARNPACWMAQNNLGYELAEAGRREEAIAYYERALQLRPGYPDAHNNLGNALRDLGRPAEALAHFEAALRRNPRLFEAHYNCGLALRDLRRREEAVACFQQALQLRPGSASAHSNLGVLLQELGRLPEAVARYEEALRLKPGLVEAQNNLAGAYGNLGRFREALVLYAEVLRRRPADAPALDGLGIALQGLDRPTEAIAHHEEALRLQPGVAEFHYNLGNALRLAGRLPEAVARYEEALRLKPDLVEVHFNLGVALKDSGQLEAAIARYEQAVRLKPDYAEAHNNLGNALKESGRLPGAIAHYEAALRLRPALAPAHYNLALALLATGQMSSAVEHYREARRLQPDLPPIAGFSENP